MEKDAFVMAVCDLSLKFMTNKKKSKVKHKKCREFRSLSHCPRNTPWLITENEMPNFLKKFGTFMLSKFMLKFAAPLQW